MAVERTDLGAANGDEKGIAGKNPARGALRHAGQLVLGEPRLKRRQGVEQAHGWNHDAPSTENDRPSLETAFRIVNFILIDSLCI